MAEADLVEYLRHCIVATMQLGAPALLVAFIAGTLMGLVQAATGIHETVVGLLPRLIAVGIALLIMLPWMLERMVDLFRSAAGVS
ncbi:MAG: flagellar biosynthetic protein FliQ [Planctomycetota bacterium]|nr:MAG: flagellar biosynthetic protein FliQ [Planctomycetota bacterium]